MVYRLAIAKIVWFKLMDHVIVQMGANASERALISVLNRAIEFSHRPTGYVNLILFKTMENVFAIILGLVYQKYKRVISSIVRALLNIYPILKCFLRSMEYAINVLNLVHVMKLDVFIVNLTIL